MKIIFLTRSLAYGGAERQLVLLAKGLHGKGIGVVVSVFYPGGALEEGLRQSGVAMVSLQKRGRWDLIPFLWRLIDLVRSEKPDILHGYQPVPNLVVTLVKILFPSIKIVWGIRASNIDLSRYDWLARLVFSIQCFFARFADLIIVNSEAGRDYHERKGFPTGKMVVILNGIDTEVFRPDSDAWKDLWQEFGIAESEKLVGLVGRLDPMKDHPTFIKAASILVQKKDNIKFICIGNGFEPYKSKLRSLAKELGLGGHLIWAGNRSNMTEIYNMLDAAVSSSSFGEGFPNVIGEAMACGTPCVVTDVGDSGRIVGDCGIVVPSHAPERLADGILKLLKEIDRQPDLGDRCRARIVENFNNSVLVDKTVEVFRDRLWDVS